MEYDKFVEMFAIEGVYEKFENDVANRVIDLNREADAHRINNTNEYQNALSIYNELVKKYSEKLSREGIISGIMVNDSVILDGLRKYGIDCNLNDFLMKVQILANSAKKIDIEDKEIVMNSPNMHK